MHRRQRFAGLAVVAAYVIAVSVTVGLHGDHVRPLYDGFAPPSGYRFVDPPAFFAPDNIEPTATSATVTLGADGSEAAGVATPDGQFVISLGRGAIASAKGATSVSVRITPLSARRLLPAVPGGLRPTGNAYHVEMTYEPHAGVVTRLVKPGTLLLEIPEIGQHLFLSSDATTWSPVTVRVIPPRQLTMTATFGAPGYYVAATNLPELAAPPAPRSNTPVLIGVATAALAALMFLGAYLMARRRRRATR